MLKLLLKTIECCTSFVTYALASTDYLKTDAQDANLHSDIRRVGWHCETKNNFTEPSVAINLCEYNAQRPVLLEAGS